MTELLAVGQEWKPTTSPRAKSRMVEGFRPTSGGYPGVTYRTSDGASHMTVEGFLRWIKETGARCD